MLKDERNAARHKQQRKHMNDLIQESSKQTKNDRVRLY